MKKTYIALLLTFIIIFLSGCFLEDMSLLYSESGEKDGFYIAVNKAADCCFVGGYNCTEYTEQSEITVPDKYDGIPIKRIGGYYGKGVPTPFSISLADIYMNAPEGSEYDCVFSGDIDDLAHGENYIVEDIVFHLNIGKHVEEIQYVDMDNYYPHINDDNSITFYRPVVSVTCSEKNKFFYSDNGKLYNKSNDELIDGFAYME